MQLQKGQRVGGYEILDLLGEGGMGQVYRAKDPRLDRVVGLKILPPSFASDPDRLERFQKEARAAGALNHPNIVTVYEVGTEGDAPFLAMELLEGETLRDLLTPLVPLTKSADEPTQKTMSPRRAVEIGSQIASGLAAAHDQGVVHRDLKPENIFITREGRVKILDFGLAKMISEIEPDVTDAPTVQRQTSPGTVLGTVGYMSPEQVRGKKVDHRSDIFSVGIILYEMLAGRRAFTGESTADMMSAILKEDPPELLDLAPSVSPALDRIVRHCLEKSPERRFQSARDLEFDLGAQAVATSSSTRIGQLKERRHFGSWALAAAVLAAILVAGLTGAWLQSRLATSEPQTTPSARSFQQITFASGLETFPTVSPDGKSIVYTAPGSDDHLDLFLQRVDGRASINLTKGSAAHDSQPAYSPDGSLIAFRSGRSGGGIFVMGATGESVRRVSDFGFNPSWSPDGKYLVVATEPTFMAPESKNAPGALYILTVQTGDRRLLIEEDGMQPSWSPDGERIAYWGLQSGSGQRDLWTISATAENPSETIVPVTADASLDWNPIWSADGKYLYFGSDRDGIRNLWRIAIDSSTGVTSGAPEPFYLPGRQAGHFSIARDQGSMAFVLVEASVEIRRASLDPLTGQMEGAEEVFAGSLLPFHWSVSPEGSWLAIGTRGQQEDLLLVRTDGSETRQLTHDAALDRGPSFSSDGSEIYFYSTRDDDNYDIWRIGIDGSGLTRITQVEGRSIWLPWAAPDGSKLAVHNMEGSSFVDLDQAMPVSELRPFPAYPDPTFRFNADSWSEDGSEILGRLSNAETGVQAPGIVSFSISEDRYEMISESAFGGTFTAHGKIFLVEPHGTYLLDRTTGESTRISGPPQGQVEISKDGKSIFFESGQLESDVWLVRIEDTGNGEGTP